MCIGKEIFWNLQIIDAKNRELKRFRKMVPCIYKSSEAEDLFIFLKAI